MRTRIMLGIAATLLGSIAYAQDITWRAANSAPIASPITLGRPQPLGAAGTDLRPVSLETPRVVRGQIGEPPNPPSFPGSGGPAVFPAPVDQRRIYDTGAVNHDGDLGGWWSRVGDRAKRCFDDVAGGSFQGGPNRQMFQCDHEFDVFSSPVTNPFFFEDPRSLTEIRPIFIWQHTPSSNPIWGGGNNFEYTVRGSVAVTENISLVISRLGFTTITPRNPTADIQSATGFSEILLGPKFTFIRNETSATVAAIGLTFAIPAGNHNVQQDTGHLSLVPYFSIAQNFGKSSYGSFNFMNTTGYTFRTDNTRTEAFYSSFHLDYDVGGQHRFYPLIEANWRHYTRNGGARALDFERNDLANFGAQSVSGHNELTLALGGRLKLNTFIWWGLAAEFNVLSNSSGQHLDQFRLTTDLIFRY